MDLKACQAFLTIIDAGSMNKAAGVLGLAQPTLSRQLARLEDELGVSLFERQAKSLRLSREGLLFARRARELLDLEQKTMSELKSFDDQVSGRLVIGCGEYAATADLVELTAKFQKMYPRVQITIITGDGAQAREMIDHGLVDLGLFMEPINLDGFKSVCWKHRELWGAIVPVDHPLAKKSVITPEDLLNEPLILPWRSEVRNLVIRWLGLPLDELRDAGSASLASTGALMVLADIGVLLSLMSVPAYRRPDLRSIPFEPQLSSCLALAWKERFPMPPVLTRFLSFLHAQSVTCSCPSQTECSCESEESESCA